MNYRKKRFWSESDIKENEKTTTLSAQLHGLSCPSCNSIKFTKSGIEKGNQRYCCSKCGKHFRSTTGKTIHHLHLKPKIKEYIDCMNRGLSLRKTAKICDISLRTAFRWRHRFLGAMQNQSKQLQPENSVLSALILPYSTKSNIKSKENSKKVTSILQLDTTGKVQICMLDKYSLVVNKFPRMTEGYRTIIKSKAIPKLLRTESASCATSAQLKQTKIVESEIINWLMKFRGVATKYLENYWSWFMLIRKLTYRNCELDRYMHKCF